jgi:hypothetical protein
MERIPNGRYTKEFRQEAVKMAAYQCWRFRNVYRYRSRH